MEQHDPLRALYCVVDPAFSLDAIVAKLVAIAELNRYPVSAKYGEIYIDVKPGEDVTTVMRRCDKLLCRPHHTRQEATIVRMIKRMVRKEA